MKQLLLVVAATALMVGPSRAQTQSAQTRNDMTIPEFRQVLIDWGSYLDARNGTDLRSKFESAPDDVLIMLYPGVSNPRELQRAVATLNKPGLAPKRHEGVKALSGFSSSQAGGNEADTPNCPVGAIIDDSSGSQCTPAFPSGQAWQTFVAPLIPIGALIVTNNDINSVRGQQCDTSVETSLSLAASILQGTVEVASVGCAALPPIASNVCFGIAAAIAVGGAVSVGLFADCVEQDGLVNAALIQAGFRNTVTIFNNLKAVDTHLTNVNNQITGEFTATNTHLTAVNTEIDTRIANLDTHLTNVDTHIALEFVALDTHLVALVAQLTTQISQATALLTADLKQVMKLELTPNGQRMIVPAILTCTGANCPNVLASCPAAGCSWNDVGPLP